MERSLCTRSFALLLLNFALKKGTRLADLMLEKYRHVPAYAG
jgi:hypothetical protein